AGREQSRGHLDAAKRIADLVGDARRHLAERRQLLALDEPLLRRDLLREIPQDADGADDRALSVEHARYREVRRKALAGARQPVDVAAPPAPLDGDACEGGPDSLALGLVEQIEVSQRRDESSRLHTEEPLARAVERDEPAFDVGRED